jgi:DNA-binding XRE family transcriptional regulator
MLGREMRRLRVARGWSQAQLAARAGVSRQLVGAVEAGRHLPRVDAGAALATALGVTVEALLAAGPARAVPVVGPPPVEGAPVRVGRVGDRLVLAPLPAGGDGWAPPDGVVAGDGVELLHGGASGAVVVGCDPALGLAAALAGGPSGGTGDVLSVAASTTAALEALAAGRTHSAVVHGPEGALPPPPAAVRRRHLARWQVGLAAAAEAPTAWFTEVLAGRRPVVQREPGAASQDALERATGGTVPAGPIASGHLEAAWWAARIGGIAVTIEPAARVAGLRFEPLETHVAQWWTAEAWDGLPAVRRLGEVLTSADLHDRLRMIGGYDLAGCGADVAA